MVFVQNTDIYIHQMVSVGNTGSNFAKNGNICESIGLGCFFS